MNHLSNYPEKVHEGDVELNNQKQVDEFGLNNYTHINGKLRVGHFGKVKVDIESLNCLDSIIFIENDLEISYNEQLIRLDGFRNLVTIGGDLNIENNSNLKSLEGFQNLSTIAGVLSIGGTSIRNFEGLENLTHVGKAIYISYNFELTDFKVLNEFIVNPSLSFHASENSYNPSRKDIIEGKCFL